MMASSGLYLHVPFCDTKCGYCDFYSVPLRDLSTSELTTCLIAELDSRERTIELPVRTIFVGGGTPTVLSTVDFERLFHRLAKVALEHKVFEFTSEANPATLDSSKIATLVECGVNRLSLGAQSFDPAELQALERLHTPTDIPVAIDLARSGGIENLNIDLIFGIPGQSLNSWRDNLERALELQPTHLACYALTYEQDTPLTAMRDAGQLTPCDHDLEAEMYALCIELLAAHGYEQYEISNFAKPDFCCEHNMVYWSNRPYIGIGPSAASFVGGQRFKNVAHMPTYIEAIRTGESACREVEKLSPRAFAGETAMLQLRLNRGIDVQDFADQTGFNPLELFADQICTFEAQGWLMQSKDRIALTTEGRFYADHVASEFIILEAADSTISLRVVD